MELGRFCPMANFCSAGKTFEHHFLLKVLTSFFFFSRVSTLDPNAAQFVGAFLTLPRATLLGAVAGISPAAATSLGLITNDQWPLLQGYIASLVPTWGTLVFNGWLAAGGGGMIVEKTVESWLYGESPC